MSDPFDPIDSLLAEHVVILAAAEQLRQAMGRLENRGIAGLEAEWPALESFAEILVGKLTLHALKEDEALFPAVEAQLGADAGPTVVMRAEHKEIHGRGQDYRAVLDELRDVHHPKLTSLSESYQELVISVRDGELPGLEDLQSKVRDLLDLIDLHFTKEEQVLFPMTRQLLDPEALSKVAREMQRLQAGAD